MDNQFICTEGEPGSWECYNCPHVEPHEWYDEHCDGTCAVKPQATCKKVEVSDDEG